MESIQMTKREVRTYVPQDGGVRFGIAKVYEAGERVLSFGETVEEMLENGLSAPREILTTASLLIFAAIKRQMTALIAHNQRIYCAGSVLKGAENWLTTTSEKAHMRMSLLERIMGGLEAKEVYEISANKLGKHSSGFLDHEEFRQHPLVNACFSGNKKLLDKYLKRITKKQRIGLAYRIPERITSPEVYCIGVATNRINAQASINNAGSIIVESRVSEEKKE